MTVSKNNIYVLTKVSLCVALLCISAYIVIPLPFTPILITAQTIIINLIALILSPKQSLLTVTVYILIGICGLPVFSGAVGGIAKLLGPTGGFLIGFLIIAPIISLLKGKNLNILRYSVVTVLIGMPLLYLCGTAFMCLVHGMNLKAALMAAVVPFIIGDVLKCIFASFLAFALNKALQKANLT